MISDRWAVVTGVAGGIGSASAVALRRAGYKVLGIDREGPPPSNDVDAFVGCDLALVGRDEAARDALVKAIRDRIDAAALSVLVNNAAVQHLAAADDLDWSAWTDTLAVNLSAPFVLAQGLLPELRAARGVVVNIGSVHARATKAGFAAYATSKAAIHGLTHALAVDVGPEVRVVCLAPAAIDTQMLRAGFGDRTEALGRLEALHPAGRIGQPEEIGEAIVWLASPGAAFMTGSVLWLDGGILSRLSDPE